VKEVSAEDVKARLGRTFDLARALLSPEGYAEFVRRARPVWS
jgi:hypothetical protein